MTINTFGSQTIDRKALIQSYGFVEHLSSNENFLQDSLELAARITGCDIAYISLLDDEHQYILSQHQSTLKTIKVKDSLCQFTIKGEDILVVDNTITNEMTRCLPQVDKADGVRFYAGCPLMNDDQMNVGALCVMDKRPKTLSQTQQDTLMVLGKQIMNTLDNQRTLIKLIKKINTNFKPAACVDLNCLQGELAHLQDEVVAQNKLIQTQKAALEASNEELLNFAYMVAHDVRAPLKTISSIVDIFEMDLQKRGQSYEKKHLNFIRKGAKNLDTLTESLLEYAKSGEDAIQDEIVNLNDVLETVHFHLTETIKSANAELVLPENAFQVCGKNLKLVQLFQNLISNGLKYQDGQRTPKVIIQAEDLKDTVRVSVIDNGIGISQNDMKKIFKPFKRLQTTQQYTGSGIGLATCKRIIDNMGSEFIVTSEVGKGSVFRFDLPKHL